MDEKLHSLPAAIAPLLRATLRRRPPSGPEPEFAGGRRRIAVPIRGRATGALYPVAVVWNPAQIAPRTWDAVIAFYRQIADQNEDFKPMQVLAQHIASGPHASALSGATSGTALLVAPHGVDWASGALRIDVDFAGTIRFVRQRRPPAKPSVTRHSPPLLIAAFDAFVRRSEWG